MWRVDFFSKISNHDFMREMRVPNGHLKSEIFGPNVTEKMQNVVWPRVGYKERVNKVA